MDKTRRRGRRTQKIVEVSSSDKDDSIEETPETDDTDEMPNPSLVLGLGVNMDVIGAIRDRKNKIAKKETSPPVKIPETSMFKNDIPVDEICRKCIKNEKLIEKLKSRLNDYEEKGLGFDSRLYVSNIKFRSSETGKILKINKKNIHCRWDTHLITDIPFPIPDSYYGGVYNVSKLFCSPNCALAYNLYFLRDGNVHYRKTLIYKLYCEMRGIEYDANIILNTAAPIEILDIYGGEQTIVEYRKRLNCLRREYVIYNPPIRPCQTYIHEQVESTANKDGKYVLKRNKPLENGKSVLSSMKLHK